VAISAILGKNYEPIRPNGSYRDLDLIILDGPRQVSEEIEKEVETSKIKLPVSFSHVLEIDESPKTDLEIFTSLRKNEVGGYSLVFKDVEMPLPDEVMQTQEAELKFGNGESITLETLSPNTIAHLYLTRVRSLKNKDLKKIREFIMTCGRMGLISKNDHDNYKVFHDFAETVNKKYPHYAKFIRAYNAIDHWLGGNVSSKMPD